MRASAKRPLSVLDAERAEVDALLEPREVLAADAGAEVLGVEERAVDDHGCKAGELVVEPPVGLDSRPARERRGPRQLLPEGGGSPRPGRQRRSPQAVLEHALEVVDWVALASR